MKKVLVVEDDTAIRQVYKMILEGVGFEMITPSSFTLEAIETVFKTNQSAIACVFCDGRLEVEIDGPDVVRHIRSLDAAVFIAVITSDDDLAVRMTSEGANVHIPKPFSAEGLQNLLRGLG